MIKNITIALLVVIIGYGIGTMLNEPMSFWTDAEAWGYWEDTTIPPDPGLVHIVPEFQGVELIVDTPSIWHINQYGDVALYVNTCWLTDFIGVVPAAPNALLDGVVHNDTAIQAATLGSIIVADATPDWNELNIGAAGNVLTVVGGTAAWAAPPAPGAWVQVAETTEIVAGAAYTARACGGILTLPQDVVVTVNCRSVNSGVVWSALSSYTPVASMVTFYWVEDGGGGLEVHICNDSQQEIMCTISFADL